ncbi:hypothetical protein [Streptomyces sp. NPDC017958]|uniref:hypothetical protein n=1 Tax=Streptomyces sp. NPDC017958 TaxID=3365021 RepID=UPI0037878AF7
MVKTSFMGRSVKVGGGVVVRLHAAAEPGEHGGGRRTVLDGGPQDRTRFDLADGHCFSVGHQNRCLRIETAEGNTLRRGRHGYTGSQVTERLAQAYSRTRVARYVLDVDPEVVELLESLAGRGPEQVFTAAPFMVIELNVPHRGEVCAVRSVAHHLCDGGCPPAEILHELYRRMPNAAEARSTGRVLAARPPSAFRACDRLFPEALPALPDNLLELR